MDQKQKLQKAYQSGSDKKLPKKIGSKNNDDIVVDIGANSPKPTPNTNTLKNEKIDDIPLRGFLKVGGLGGYRKAAKFLLLLGKREAATVLKHFSDREIQEITREIASIKQINKEEAAKLLKDFGYLKPGLNHSTGGLEVAKNMLTTAFGSEKGEAILKKVIPFNGEKPFSFLEDLEFQQLIMILRKEPVHVLTVILSFLDPVKSSKVLESMSPEVQTSLITRMAGMEKVAPEVIMSMEEVLIERIRMQGKVISEDVDGQSVLAEILKNMDLSDESRILDNLADSNEELAESVKDRLFTVNTIHFVQDTDMEKILREFTDTEIAILLKGQDSELRNKIIYNVSKRRVEFITYEEDALGVMRKSDVDQAMKEFLEYLKDKEIQGNIVLFREKDEYI
ncbi:MAG: flagellar motor switch protein FliG [Spirochaetia bacterium]|nr:flagellar motor switch protein FliG [Spirochaetia bacterium]